MSKLQIIRAWKDETYRHSLSAEQRAALPANPAGAIELTEAELDVIAGGIPATKPRSTCPDTSRFCCGD